MEFHHVTLAGEAQSVGHDGQAPEDQGIAPPLPGGLVVGPSVEQVPLHRAQVFRPLVFHMDQRPLPPAEGKVLQSGKLEEVLVPVHGHPIRVQVTPAGRASSSTVTA